MEGVPNGDGVSGGECVIDPLEEEGPHERAPGGWRKWY
jgi:hypothetical protein